MRLALAVAPIVFMLSAGCSSAPSATVEDPAQDAMEAMHESLTDALEGIRARQDAAENGEEAEDATPLPQGLAAVVAAAQDLVKASTGQPSEPDAKAILSAAQELETRAKGAAAEAAIKQGLEELRAKVDGLKGKRTAG